MGVNFVELPTDWFPTYTGDATNISIDLTDLPELATAEALTASGDIREVLFSICEAAYLKSITLSGDAASTYMTISKSISNDVAAGTATESFTLRFTTVAADRNVVTEPV